MRDCGECTKGTLCDVCDKLLNQLEEFLAVLNERKKQPPNEEFGHLLPKYIITWMW